MKPYTLFLLSLFLACRIYAQAPIAFERYYDFGWGNSEEGYCVQQTTDHGYIICGVQNRGIGDTRMLLTKTDSAGNVLWTKLWGNGNDQQEAYSVKQTNDGGYILTGFLAGTNYSKYVGLVKTDSNGDTLWTKKFNGLVITSAGWGPRGEDVLQMPDSGYVVIAVGSDAVDTVAETILIRTDANGDTLWTKKYRRLYGCGGNSIQQTADGGFIIGGYVSITSSYFSAAYLIKTNAIGDTLWTKILNGPNTQSALVIHQTANGGYFIRGSVGYLNSSSDFLLIRSDSNGDTLWTKTIGGSALEGGGGQLTTDGGYIITGVTTSYGDPSGDVILVKTDSSGNTQWTKIFGHVNYGDQGYFVQQTNDSGFILCGYTSSFSDGGSLYLIKTDSMGNAPTGISPFSPSEIQINIYPNPFNDFTNIQLSSETGFPCNLILYDFSGREVGHDEVNSSSFILERNGLASGIYCCAIRDSEGKIVCNKKIIVQ